MASSAEPAGVSCATAVAVSADAAHELRVSSEATAALAAEGYALALVRGTLRLHATRAVDDLTVYSLNNTGWSEDDLDGTTAPGHAALTAMLTDGEKVFAEVVT